MREQPAVRRLFPTRSFRSAAAVAAVGIAFLMMASPLAAATAAVLRTGGPLPVAQLGAPSPYHHAAPMTGSELQKGPFVSSGSTPLASNPTAKVLATTAGSDSTAFTVGFALRDPQGLANLISAQQTPGSPLFQHWLSSAQEMQMFGPDPAVVQNTINYYTSMGFTLRSQGAISLSFTGNVAQADRAFHTTLSNVQDGQPHAEVMNSAPLEIPQALANSIASVNGFEGTARFHTTLMGDPASLADGLAAGASYAPSGVPALAPLPGVETNKTNESVAYNYTTHAFYWFNYFSNFYKIYRYRQVITPASLNYMYDASPLLAMGYNGNHTAGKQITIGIVMAGGINPGDIKAYGRMLWNNPYQLLNRISPMPVDHQSGLNGTQTWTDGGSGEMALDIEYSGTMAPGAKILPVYGLCLCTNELDDDYAALDGLAKIPNIISNSWGEDEDAAGTLSGPSWQNDITMHNYFMLLTARGATILASSADGGGFDKGSGILAGSFPATDPYILSIDGVRTAAASASGQIFPNPSNYGLANITVYVSNKSNFPVHVNTAEQMAYQSFWYEPAFNTSLYSAAPIAAGGFGTSYWFNQSWYEHGLGVPDVGRSLGSGVAAEADFNQSIFFNGAFETGYGGTSFACPTVAGELADVLDYLQANGHSPYLGEGNAPVFWVGNAYWNHNLTVNPFFDILNGTSYWGNHGVESGWQWPPGQVFPKNETGAISYGNTLSGWDFPTGWGVPNVLNFAMDLEHLLDLPGSITTTNAAGNQLSPGTWANLATNQTYYFHVNETAALRASNPTLTVQFDPKVGLTLYPGTTVAQGALVLHPTIQSTANGTGISFSLNTGNPSGIDGPGLLIFTLGNSTTSNLAFEYDYVNWALPTGGALSVSVVSPSSGTSIVGGSSTFGAGAGFFFPPIVAAPTGFNGENLLTVRVLYNGVGVYNARVTATVASPYDLAFEGSRALNVSQSYGQAHTQLTTTMSTSFTNLTGYAYVWTWNVIKPTNLNIYANYSTATATTNYTMIPPPNIALSDNYGGRFSEFNWIAWVLYATRQPVTKSLEELWAPNSINQSGYYNLLYTWQGEKLKVNVNDYQGNPIANTKVWFGNYDLGRETRFADYVGSGGVIGYTNDSKSVGITQGDGSTYIEIPQNESLQSGNPIFGNGGISTFNGPAAIGAIAADIPGMSNITVQTTQPCLPQSVLSTVLLACNFNDSVQTNYTSVAALVMPDPVNAWTQTSTGVARDFFGTGNNISFGVKVNLPTNDPYVSGYGFNWPSGDFHITNVTAYVDGKWAGQNDPAPYNNYQTYYSGNNLTLPKSEFPNGLSVGIHELTVEVDVSSGQIFTYTHKFVIGGVQFGDLSISNTYTQVPYNLNWSLNLSASQVNNHTFSQSLEIQYVTGGCNGVRNPCPLVVNLTEKIHRNVLTYNQSINLTMLNLNHFYSGAGGLPSGQYLITLWLNANHSGNVTAQLPTYLVFNDLNGTFTNPTPNQQVPMGNVTIGFSYRGGYLSNATLFIFAQGESLAPVYSQGIFIPAVGSGYRGGSASWYATVPGAYQLVMNLGTPYTHTNISEWINVTLSSPIVYLNSTHAASAVGGMSAASVGTALAIAGAVIGFLIGLFAAPAFRGAPKGPTSARPGGYEDPSMGSSGKPECSVCHEHFDTPYALHAHQKAAHGIEE